MVIRNSKGEILGWIIPQNISCREQLLWILFGANLSILLPSVKRAITRSFKGSICKSSVCWGRFQRAVFAAKMGWSLLSSEISTHHVFNDFLTSRTWQKSLLHHHMSDVSSQITDSSSVCSTGCLDCNKEKIKASLGEYTCDCCFPFTRASNKGNVFISRMYGKWTWAVHYTCPITRLTVISFCLSWSFRNYWRASNWSVIIHLASYTPMHATYQIPFQHRVI